MKNKLTKFAFTSFNMKADANFESKIKIEEENSDLKVSLQIKKLFFSNNDISTYNNIIGFLDIFMNFLISIE